MALRYRSAVPLGKAACALLRAELALRTCSLERACRQLGIAPPGSANEAILDSSDLSESAKRSIRTTTRAVERAARWLPLPNTCLRRALALGWLLRELRPRLSIGVTMERGFEAHAWLEIRGTAVGSDGAAAQRFQILRRPTRTG